MDIIRHKGARIHVGCGGEVVRGRCLKCGEKDKRNILKKVFVTGPLVIKEADIKETERKAHRERIRKGKDIFKE